ncbi:MAG: hypothetical protein JW934_21550 [Anaerolineae bacterium]|nr:hypothetical protein [Anaerolineae bacterium]
MNKFYQNRLFWGLLLVGVGVILLFQNLNIFKFVWDVAWIGILGVGSALFFMTFLGNRSQWWAVIPSAALLGLALSAAVSLLFPALGARVGGALFLIVLAQSFWIIYLRDRGQWWAIIPCGALFTIAAVDLVETLLPRVETGGLFFLGLGATFGLVYLLPASQGRMRWAIIPAVILIAIGLVISFASTSLLQMLWPAAIILAGGWMLMQAFWPRKR